MAQSYKTNQRFTFLRRHRFFLLCLLLWVAGNGRAAPQKKQPDNRRARFFQHYEYRFIVPGNLANDVWKYMLAQLPPGVKRNEALEDENLTDLYFDTKARSLRNRNIALRQRFFISGDGRKEYLQLLLPPRPDSVFGTEVRFKHNKHPDKGRNFTNHPVLKMLRTKDRPVLDSLLHMYGVNVADMGTVLEVNQDRRQLHLRQQDTDWIILTLTVLKVQAPEHLRIQLQIQADPVTLKLASPQRKQQLIKATNALAQKFRSQFPDLEPEGRQEYVLMESLRHTPAVQKVNTKVVFAVSFLALIVTVVLVRYFRRKPAQPFQ